jgi:UDP-N-acetylmuramoyl-tripeptide--D-alanyl-D-alanine ligase
VESRSLAYVSEACAGELLGGPPDLAVRRVGTDSRHTQPGELFVALSGDVFDGHKFIGEAVVKGAAAVMVEQGKAPDPLRCPVIIVENTRRALGRLARRYRQDFQLPIIAICGSNGKTTTKELVAAVLRQKLNTLWSESSFNNDIGVPATLLRLESTHQAAVLEVGTNHPGELAPLIELFEPRYGVVTNIGREHLEFFGDIDGVVREEGKIAEMLPGNGRLFLNGDSEWSDRLSHRATAPAVRLGFGEHNQWRGRVLRFDKDGVTFLVSGPRGDYCGEYRVNLLGRHQVLNSLYAIAVGAELGVGPEEVKSGLAACKPPPMRLQLWDFNGVRVLDDAYNANADSMIAALETLRDIPCKGRRLAVLGEMAELGNQSEAAHEEVGRRAAELGVGQLFAVGAMSSVLARGAREAGLTRVLEFPNVESAAPAVKSFLRSGDVLLLKASRRAHFERLAALLKSD